MMRVNANPQRWADETGRVRVVEGRHPSDPHGTGYNLTVDAAWLGTYGTLDGAANAAAAYLGWRGVQIEDSKVVLRAEYRPGDRFGDDMHLVIEDEDDPQA